MGTLSSHLNKKKKIRPGLYRKEISKSEFLKIINKKYDGDKNFCFFLANDDSNKYDLLIFNYKHGKKETVAFIGFSSGVYEIFIDIDNDIDKKITNFIKDTISKIDSIYFFDD